MQKGKSVVRVEVIDGLEIFVDKTVTEKLGNEQPNIEQMVRDVKPADGQSGGSGVRRMNLGGDKDE